MVDLDGVAAITSDQVTQVFLIALFGSIGLGVLRTLTRTDLTWREKILGDPPKDDPKDPEVTVRPVLGEFAGQVEVDRLFGRVGLGGQATTPRFDLGGLWSLLPALREEWAGLNFAPSGLVTNPLTGQHLDTLVLVSKRHRQPGAEYSLTLAAPTNGPESGLAEPEVTAVDLRLEVDDHRQLKVLVADPKGAWSAQVTLGHDAEPSLEVALRANLNAILANEGETSTLARLLFGGKATVDATIDTATLRAKSGDLASASGRVNRFPFRAHLAVDSSQVPWKMDFAATIKARRLGRLLVLFASGPLQRDTQTGLAGIGARWDRHLVDLRSQIVQLEAAIHAAGGPEQYVHRWLWDPAFSPRSIGLDS